MLTDSWPRRMNPDEEPEVRKLFRLCHPQKPGQAPFWYFVHPTLVVDFDSQIVGSTSFTLVIAPGFGSTLYGKDVCVHPDYRGRGLGRLLHTARLSMGGSAGAQIFMGMTHKDNFAMQKILEKSGMHPCVPVGDDILFTGPIGEV